MIYSSGEVSQKKSANFFVATGSWKIAGIKSYPPVIGSSGKVLLKADLQYPDGSDPWLRWSYKGKVIQKGALSQGLGKDPLDGPRGGRRLHHNAGDVPRGSRRRTPTTPSPRPSPFPRTSTYPRETRPGAETSGPRTPTSRCCASRAPWMIRAPARRRLGKTSATAPSARRRSSPRRTASAIALQTARGSPSPGSPFPLTAAA